MRPGFLVPYRDMLGRVVGLSYRVDDPGDGGKCVWVSSDPHDTLSGGGQKYPRGAKLTPPVHVAGRDLFPSAPEIWLTEGALKADIASFLLNVPMLAAGGVTQWGEGFAEHFRRCFPGARAVVAYDADWRDNTQIRWALESLMARLRGAGVMYVVRSWPLSEGKGIDDLALTLSQQKREVRAA